MALASAAWAQEIAGVEPDESPPSGPTLFSGAWTALLGIDTAAEDPQEDVLSLRNRLDLELRHPLASQRSVALSARLWHRAQVGHRPGQWTPAFTGDLPDLGMRYDAVAELRDASMSWTRPWGRLTIGRATLNWGTLELQSPLRVLAPSDFSQGLVGALSNPDESPLLPTWLVRWEAQLGPGQLDAVYLPFFEQHRLSPFATDAAFVRPGLGPELPASIAPMLRRLDLRLDRSLGDTLVLALKPPSATPLDGSLGLRYAARLGGWDVALQAVAGWDRMPELRFDQDLLLLLGATASAGFDLPKLAEGFSDPAVAAAAQRSQGKALTDLVQASWRRRLLVGLEAQGEPVDGWLVRAELGWSPGKVLIDQQFRPIRSAQLLAGAGLEHGLGDWLNALAEVTWQFSYDAPGDLPLLMTARHQIQVAGGLQARLGDGQPWTVQLGGLYGVSLGDWAAAPRVAYTWEEGWTVALGAVVADGPPLAPGGLFRTDDQVLCEVRRQF